MTLALRGIDPSLGKSFALERALADIAANVGEQLSKLFEGYPWYVRADGERAGGCILISIPRLSGNYRKQITFAEMANDPTAQIADAGAEILERFGLHRGKMRPAEWAEVCERFPVPLRPIAVVTPGGKRVEVTPDVLR